MPSCRVIVAITAVGTAVGSSRNVPRKRTVVSCRANPRRTKAGLDAARKEGRIGGRPPKLKPQQQQEIVKLVKRGKKAAADAARLFGVHPATVSRLLQRT